MILSALGERLDLLHIDNPINLLGCQLAQSILAPWSDILLVQLEPPPVDGDVFAFSVFLENGFEGVEGLGVDGDVVGLDFRGLFWL